MIVTKIDEIEDDDHWRAQRLRKQIEDRRRRAKEDSSLGVKRGEKKRTRDAATVRALQVRFGLPSRVA